MTLQTLLVGFLFDNPAAQDYEGVESRRPGERSESTLQSFFLCFFNYSLFSCSRTTVTATWKLWGCPWLAASIRLSQAAFRLLYLSETFETEEQLLETGI
jgi:hypothetical protein